MPWQNQNNSLNCQELEDFVGVQFLRFILELGKNAAQTAGACVLSFSLSVRVYVCVLRYARVPLCVCVSAVIAVTVIIAVVACFAFALPKNMINDILHLFSMMIIYTSFAIACTN